MTVNPNKSAFNELDRLKLSNQVVIIWASLITQLLSRRIFLARKKNAVRMSKRIEIIIHRVEEKPKMRTFLGSVGISNTKINAAKDSTNAAIILSFRIF